MNKKLFIFCLTLSLFLLVKNTHSNEIKCIYGVDDRIDLFNVVNDKYLQWAKSTAAMIPNFWLIPTTDGQGMKFDAVPSNLDVCSSERFSNQISIAKCTGFLISPDLLITAGHCMKSSWSCSDYYWIFDFNMDSPDDNPLTFSNNQIYKCDELITAKHFRNDDTIIDYAIIRLDREVSNRTPLKIRKTGKVPDNASLISIGQASGLPTKVVTNGVILDNSDKFTFTANIDVFGGNSGSPVIDENTGLVEGIVSYGNNDYVLDKKNQCFRPAYFSDNPLNDGQEGEKIFRIPYLINMLLELFPFL